MGPRLNMESERPSLFPLSPYIDITAVSLPVFASIFYTERKVELKLPQIIEEKKIKL